MLTKSRLINLLEPFDDDTEIVVLDKEHKFLYSPNVYYQFRPTDDSAKLVLSLIKPSEKSVELKV